MRIPLRLSSSARYVLVTGILLSSAACATSHPWTRIADAPIGEPTKRDMDPSVQIQISNHSFWDLRIFVERSGVEFPLGRVDRMETVVFRASEGMLAGAHHYSLVTRPCGAGRGFRTEPVVIVPGRLHRWTLMPTNALFHGVEG